MRGIVLIALVASACSFRSGALPDTTDAAPDGPPPITVGFAKDTTQTDEEAGTIAVRVILSQAATESISVAYAVTGGTAERPSDFLLNDGTLTFAPSDVEETIDITIGPDGMDEPNETIVLTLSDPSTGSTLGLATHTVTIDMNALPRVNFSVATSADGEAVAAPAVNIVLDRMSLLTTSVEVMVTGGNATQNMDYAVTSTTVTFNPGETSKPIPLAITDDIIDEQNEDVTLTLVNPTNVVIGTTAPTNTHTINDDDVAPTVEFDDVTARISEAGPFIDIAVSLSAESGKNFNVPFTVSSASTASAADYSVVTPSPLAFTAGTTTLDIRVNITQDMLVEGNETVVLTLGMPTPMPNATLGTDTTHTLTIRDDDQTCQGPAATAWELCFPTPTAPVALLGTINTDTSPLCQAAPLSGWAGQPDSCFIVGTDIGAALDVRFTGTRPVVLFATGNVGIVGNLDLAGHRSDQSAGPGSGIGCAAYSDPPLDSTSGAGGGAGGSFRTAGGNGGDGNGAADSGGTALAATPGPPATLRGGCTGQRGGNGFGNPMIGSTGGVPGGGGGAIYIVAGGTITVSSGSTINVSGGGGDAVTTPDNGFFGGGGGGGSGGMIALHATAYVVTGARFMANGGGGSSGADNDTAGQDGSDPSTASPGNGGSGGSGGGAGGSGGRGFGIATTVASGSDGNSNNGGGGGGGGGGYISSNLPLTGANTVSAGDIDP